MDNLSVFLLNVGRSDCILLQFPDKSWAIIDCGGQLSHYAPPNQIIGFLKDEEPSNSPIQFILATHPDTDHDGGIRQLLSMLPREVHALYYTGLERLSEKHGNKRGFNEDLNQESFVEEAKRLAEKGQIQEFGPLKEGDEIHIPSIEDVSISVLWPPKDLVDSFKDVPNLGAKKRNDISVVLRIEYASRVLIFFGDVQGEEACNHIFGRMIKIPDVIKAPHHGGHTYFTEWDRLPEDDKSNFILLSNPSLNRLYPRKEFLEKISNWKIRCTGISKHCEGKQAARTWPYVLKARSFIPDSMQRIVSVRNSFNAILERGRAVTMNIHPECCIYNHITIKSNGEIVPAEFDKACDK